jgi:putative membrane protein
MDRIVQRFAVSNALKRSSQKMSNHPIRVAGALLLATTLTVACSKTENETVSTDTTATDTAVTSTTTMASDTTATTSTMATPSATLQQADQDFVMKAAQGGLAEVTMGQTASQKATNADVKTFGTRMVTDHGQANSELSQLAASKGVTLPTEPGEEHKKAMEHLNTLSGAAFDKAYMEHMVSDHEKDVKEFEEASKNLQDPDLKGWATKTLPTLQEHLRLAKETQGKVK